jgi:uncharacterized protein
MKFINGLSCDLDFSAPGRSLGAIALTVSDDQHEFSTLEIPIAVISRGVGPTVLLTAGNHGDEYEGQVVLRHLVNDLRADQITGRIIVLPALNYPAVMADARVSPIDRGNLNRSFPGNPEAGPTGAIAHFVSQTLLPLADAAIDLHSGGHHATYVPCAFLCTHHNPDILRRSLAMAEAFAAPFTYVCRGSDGPTALDPIAHDAGVPLLSAELAGAAGVDVRATAVGYDGVLRVLHMLGVVTGPHGPTEPTRFLDGIKGAHTVSSPITGMFEPLHDVGTEVMAGAPAGFVWSLEEFERPPIEVHFQSAGVIAAKRATARVRRGSHLYLVAPQMSREAVLGAEGTGPFERA